MFGTLTIIFDVLEEIIVKVIENRYIGIFPIINKIINIGRRLPRMIGDLKELSAKLSILKMTAELSKIYRYEKIDLSSTLHTVDGFLPPQSEQCSAAAASPCQTTVNILTLIRYI